MSGAHSAHTPAVGPSAARHHPERAGHLTSREVLHAFEAFNACENAHIEFGQNPDLPGDVLDTLDDLTYASHENVPVLLNEILRLQALVVENQIPTHDWQAVAEDAEEWTVRLAAAMASIDDDLEAFASNPASTPEDVVALVRALRETLRAVGGGPQTGGKRALRPGGDL